MTPRSRFKDLIKRSELVVLALAAAIGVSLYLSGTVFAQAEYDYWQSYLDSYVSGATIMPTPGDCGTGTIVLQWSAISQADGYRLARDGSDVVYEGASRTYTDTGLTAGSLHRYYLTAYKEYTTSNTTKMVSATAPGNCVQTPPSPPTNVAASFNQSANGIVLTWTQSSSYASFNIMRRTGGGSFAQIGSFTGTQATYTDATNLSPGTTYEYQVIGCSNIGCSGPSNSASATTPNSTAQTTPTTTGSTTTTTTTVTQTPSPATGLTAQFSISASGIVLSWTNAGSVAATTISIERRTTGGTFAAIHSVSGSQTTHTDSSSLSPATTYEYRIISCNGTGNCATSANIATATTPSSTTGTNTTTNTTTTTTTTTTGTTGTSGTTSTTGTSANTTTSTTGTSPAAPVVSVSAPAGCGTFTLYLSWAAVSGASSYDIYRDYALVIHTTGTSFADLGLSPGTQHTYRVAARNSYGVTPSAFVNGTVPSSCAVTTATTTTTQTQPVTQPTTATSVVAPTQEQPVQPKPVQTVVPKTVTVQPEPVTTVEPAVYVAPPPQQSAPVTAAQAQFVATLQTVADNVASSQVAVDTARKALIASIDEHINAVLRATPPGGTQADEKTIQKIRTQLINTIEISFSQGTMPSAADEARLQEAIKEGFAAIDRAATFDQSVPSGTQQTVADAIGVFADAVEQATKSLEASGAGDVYKDTNNDGISDYDSVHIYNIDPIKPTPVTIVDGKKLTAGDKVLLGYDPTAKALVALPREEAEASFAPETTVYKVEAVKLTEKKQVAIAGTALPNSYVTLYIYSTPIVVTVKTDRNGKWEYTMDRELESGEHKIYAASVDNTGKIVAKTVAIPFTKTAEAATLGNIPSLGAASVEKPSITNNRAVYPLIALSLLFIFGALYVIGKDRQAAHNIPPTPQA